MSQPRLCEMKYEVRDEVQGWRGHHRKANVETWANITARLTVAFVGPRPKHSFTDRMLFKATSYTLLYTTLPIIRCSVHERRPDGHGHRAFPSLKTASAFMAAEETRIERGWAWGMGMYTFAAGIGMLQLYNDRCYVTDVVAGAGFGILTTHAAYWLLPLERRWLGLDKRRRSKDMGLMFVPTYEHDTHTVGLAFSAQL